MPDWHLQEAAGLALCVAQHEAEAAGLERQVAAIREELVRRDDALRTERAAQQEQLESLKTVDFLLLQQEEICCALKHASFRYEYVVGYRVWSGQRLMLPKGQVSLPGNERGQQNFGWRLRRRHESRQRRGCACRA